MMHAFLRRVASQMRESVLWKRETEAQWEETRECLERIVMHKVMSPTTRPTRILPVSVQEGCRPTGAGFVSFSRFPVYHSSSACHIAFFCMYVCVVSHI